MYQFIWVPYVSGLSQSILSFIFYVVQFQTDNKSCKNENVKLLGFEVFGDWIMIHISIIISSCLNFYQKRLQPHTFNARQYKSVNAIPLALFPMQIYLCVIS